MGTLIRTCAARGMKPLFEAETAINIQIFDTEGHFFLAFKYNISADNKKELVEAEAKRNEKIKTINFKNLKRL